MKKMTKIRKNVIGAVLCLMVLLVGVCALAACGSKDLSVTFTVEGKTQTVDVVNGKVTMPADPEKEFYELIVKNLDEKSRTALIKVKEGSGYRFR